jgi:hypothetical protein
MKQQIKLVRQYTQKQVLIEQKNEKMKRAERMIERYTFALRIF